MSSRFRLAFLDVFVTLLPEPETLDRLLSNETRYRKPGTINGSGSFKDTNIFGKSIYFMWFLCFLILFFWLSKWKSTQMCRRPKKGNLWVSFNDTLLNFRLKFNYLYSTVYIYIRRFLDDPFKNNHLKWLTPWF